MEDKIDQLLALFNALSYSQKAWTYSKILEIMEDE